MAATLAVGGSVQPVPTPHLAAASGDFAADVLLPGDPLRAQWIADTFLESPRLVTSVRNILGFTGTVDGRPVSVVGTGMGMPSIAIYATELITEYGCRRLVRVGSCGALQPEVGLRSVVVAVGACTDSNINRQRFGGFDFAAVASAGLLVPALAALEASGLDRHVGTVLSTDLFYPPVTGQDPLELYAPAVRMGVLAVEMEAAALYGVAAQYRAEALAVCTVSDQLVHRQHLSPVERQSSFHDMVTLTLDALRRADRA
jgi:purine-nucleoside phosphorylase